MSDPDRKVVVTAVGMVTPCGLDTESTWRSLIEGRSGIGAIEGFDASAYPSRIAGECTGFDPERYIERKRLREMARFIHLAIAAASEVMERSGWEPTEEEKERSGVFLGVGMCGLDILEKTARTLFDKGPRRVSPYFIPAVISNLAPGQISMRWGLRGPNYTTTSACASGSHAIGEAMRWIQRGDLDVALAGGAEAAVSPLGVGGFTAMRALSKRNDEPERASRPFDRGRDGFVIAEGAAILLLESEEHARARGAEILAEVAGYGSTSDAHHLTQPAPEGRGAQRAMRLALRDAGIDARDVDYVNAHATSTPAGDEQEALAIKAVFGAHATEGTLWVSATKSMTGHLLGAAGGLEAAITVLALHRGVVPPTLNLEEPDPECEGLELLPGEARERAIRHALSNSFGFGGTNVTLAFRAAGR